MSIRKSRFTIAVLWAMIPLTVFGSQPRMGCICANGQHKFFCERHRNGDLGGRCTCCFGRAKAQNGSLGEMNGLRRARNGCPDGSLAVGANRPCRPVLDKTTYVNGPKKAIHRDRADAAPLFSALDPLPATTHVSAAEFRRGELLPPPDLVITLGVRLI